MKIRDYIAELIMITLFVIVMSSCGTWKWVEPVPPNAANNHRYNSICK